MRFAGSVEAGRSARSGVVPLQRIGLRVEAHRPRRLEVILRQPARWSAGTVIAVEPGRVTERHDGVVLLAGGLVQEAGEVLEKGRLRRRLRGRPFVEPAVERLVGLARLDQRVVGAGQRGVVERPVIVDELQLEGRPAVGADAVGGHEGERLVRQAPGVELLGADLGPFEDAAAFGPPPGQVEQVAPLQQPEQVVRPAAQRLVFPDGAGRIAGAEGVLHPDQRLQVGGASPPREGEDDGHPKRGAPAGAVHDGASVPLRACTSTSRRTS